MLKFFKKEAVFCIALLLTIITMFFNTPTREYLNAIDFKMLSILFSLMAISSALKKSGFLETIAINITNHFTSFRSIALLLVYIVFFSAMLLTNDVSLLVFIPFTLLLIRDIEEKNIIILIILETLAANLGSMATPIGNPQNLFIYSAFNLTAKDFFVTMFFPTALSFILLTLSTFLFCSKNIQLKVHEKETSFDKKNTAINFILLALVLLTVFKVLDFRIPLTVVLLYMLFFARSLFKEIDYFLLLTFICFFIFSYNISHIEVVNFLLTKLMDKAALLTSTLASQVISNVPAAVLLSSATSNWQELMLGVDIGGLGTLIASLASLISFKFYANRESSNKGKYITFFSAFNFIYLIILYVTTKVLL